MTKIYFRDAAGNTQVVDAIPGQSLMESAVDAGVPFVVGECSGALACATCHVSVDEQWWDKVESPGEFEAAMLDGLELNGQRSRLCCQIKVSKALDGFTVSEPTKGN